MAIPSPLQPEKNPNRRFSTWRSNEIYTGTNGTGAYVPNLNDLVFGINGGVYLVTEVDYTSGLSILSPTDIFNQAGGASVDDSLLSIGPGYVSEAFTILLDTTVVPHVMSFDHRFYIPGSEASYVKVFKGANISSNGTVISAMFNPAGQKTSENIPLESFNMGTALKRPVSAYSTNAILPGELLSVVVYNSAGVAQTKYRMVASISNAIRNLNAAYSHVTSIELVSDFISLTDNNLIEIPANMNLDATLMRGKVYRVGEAPVVLPIDGSRFMIHGLSAFVASIPGQYADVVLAYKLGSTESAYNTQYGDVLSRSYRVRTIASNNAFAFKLYAVPVWATSPNRWTLQWYLYNLDRDIMIDVTSLVTPATGSQVYDGNPGNQTVQNIQVSFNWQSVAVGNPYYYHTQALSIRNYTAASEILAITGDISQQSHIAIKYSDNIGYYGTQMKAKIFINPSNAGQTNIDVSNGYETVNEWLDEYYFKLMPMNLLESEFDAPKPTHVRVSCGNFFRVIAIEDINQPIVHTGIPISPSPQGKTLLMEYIQRSGAAEIELACGYMILEHTTL